LLVLGEPLRWDKDANYGRRQSRNGSVFFVEAPACEVPRELCSTGTSRTRITTAIAARDQNHGLVERCLLAFRGASQSAKGITRGSLNQGKQRARAALRAYRALSFLGRSMGRV